MTSKSRKKDNSMAPADLEDMFSLQDKLEVLEILKENSYSYSVTSRKVGVHPTTLRLWAKQLLPFYDEDASAVAEVMMADDDELEAGYTKTVKEVRLLILERMRTVIPKEKDLAKLTTAMKTLHDIATSKLPWNGETNTEANNYYQQINNIIINGSKSSLNGKKN